MYVIRIKLQSNEIALYLYTLRSYDFNLVKISFLEISFHARKNKHKNRFLRDILYMLCFFFALQIEK